MNPALMAVASNIDINKIIKIIVIIIAIVFGVRYIRKFIKKRKNQATLNELDKDINVSKLTYQLSYYGIWAKDLFNAMDGMGTNEQVIYDVFKKMQTKDDVLQLITAFGVEDEETLTQWIVSELGDSERATLNRLLTDKNINYQF
jgi:uncharacterized protein YuzB (UPF0349 family)